MSDASLVSGHGALIKGASQYFADQHETTKIEYAAAIDDKLQWKPSLHFQNSNHIIVAAETSDTPYPKVLKLRHAEIVALQVPIAVYAVCPEEEFLLKARQPEIQELESHGFGLITVDSAGVGRRRIPCIPLIQHIPIAELNQEIAALPKAWRGRVREAYDKYLHNGVSGVQDISEILEGAVRSAGSKCAKRGWIAKGAANSATADILDALMAAAQCKPALAAIGGARGYIKQHRNPAHHPATTKAAAIKKIRNVPHGFRDGIKQIVAFRDAFKNLGVSVSF